MYTCFFCYYNWMWVVIKNVLIDLSSALSFSLIPFIYCLAWKKDEKGWRTRERYRDRERASEDNLEIYRTRERERERERVRGWRQDRDIEDDRERERGREEGNVLFNDALTTFYLRLYGVGHMVKDHSDSERGNPLSPHRLLFPISSKGSFICTIP